MQRLTAMLLLALVLIVTTSGADEFFDERYVQVVAGASYFPTVTMVVVGDIGSEILPTMEFIQRHALGPTIQLVAPVREWLKVGAAFSWAYDSFAYEEEGRMESEFNLQMTAYSLAIQAPFSIFRSDWLDVDIVPGFNYYGASHRPDSIIAHGETYSDVDYRGSAEWTGTGFSGFLSTTLYFGDLLVKLDGGWIVGGVDVDRKLFIEGDGDEESDIFIDPASTLSNFQVNVGVGYFL